MTRRMWILLVVLILLGGVLLRDLAARSVDRFAIWDSTLATAVGVTTTTPGGSTAGLAVRPLGLTTSTGVSVLRETTGSESVRVWLERRLDPVNDQVSTLPTPVSLKRYISVGTSEDESEVKATAGVLVGLSATNAHASSAAFIKCTNLTAANTTPGTSAIFYSVMVPAAGGVVDGTIEATFSTALTCYIVLGKADSAVDEVAANDVTYNLRYR